MTTDGGGWTAIMNPVNPLLGNYSLGAKMTVYTSTSNCRVENFGTSGGKWIYANSYVCAGDTSYVQLDWTNILNASEVLLRAVGNGMYYNITLNGDGIISTAIVYNAFALTGQSCGTNMCWNTDTFRNNSIPIKKNFSGNLIIKAGGRGNGFKWGGAGSIWGVLVR